MRDRTPQSVTVAEIQAWIPQAVDVIDRLTADNAQLRQALEPFARHTRATSLTEALNHISREDLLRATRALAGEAVC